MSGEFIIKRTNSNDPDFQLLVTRLDHELWNELKEDQATYDQYNKVPDLPTVILVYANEKPVATGCFKQYDDNTVEIKRMFVEKDYRGKGLSKIVLDELETWAMESGFQYAILETSVHFNVAQNLYAQAGYSVIENYDQYKGLEESVCMKKELDPQALRGSNDVTVVGDGMISSFRDVTGIEYFDFENDFVERNIRCIPMIVRFKMDKAGIKLKLAEWSKFDVDERIELATRPVSNEEDVKDYHAYLSGLVKKHTAKEATGLAIDLNPAWANRDDIPVSVIDKLKEFGWFVSIDQWKALTNLQRFALVKLSREGHESKNFPKAVKEFELV
jgi:putative acetyltransferase